MAAMSKWEVTTDPLTLRRLGKLGEELGELANVASRCIIQGIDATDPGTGKVNHARLLDELADVAAQIECTLSVFGLDRDYFGQRAARKVEQMAEWESLYPRTSIGDTPAPQSKDGADGVKGIPAPGHSWRDFGQLGGRNVSWCSRCDALAALGVLASDEPSDSERLRMVLHCFSQRKDNMPLTPSERDVLHAFAARGEFTDSMRLRVIDSAIRAARADGVPPSAGGQQ